MSLRAADISMSLRAVFVSTRKISNRYLFKDGFHGLVKLNGSCNRAFLGNLQAQDFSLRVRQTNCHAFSPAVRE